MNTILKIVICLALMPFVIYGLFLLGLIGYVASVNL